MYRGQIERSSVSFAEWGNTVLSVEGIRRGRVGMDKARVHRMLFFTGPFRAWRAVCEDRVNGGGACRERRILRHIGYGCDCFII